MDTVIDIAEAGYCSGCGVCAGTCPRDALSIIFNKYGEYVPVLNKSLCTNCGICLKICPFSDRSKNEDEIANYLVNNNESIKYQKFIGFYQDAYVAHATDENIRLNSASGGVATQLLVSLLQENLVDYVACVLPRSGNKESLFSYQLLNQPDEVIKGSHSVYYPVEASALIKQIINLPRGRIAFIGLPCTIKALRNAIDLLKGKFKDKDILFLGLTCGGMRSKAYTEYLFKKNFGSTKLLKGITYRMKQDSGKANDYGYRFSWLRQDAKNVESSTIWKDKIRDYWMDEYFKLNSCTYCDDIFAEISDISLMDAWLPQYIDDWKGNNLILTRSKAVDDWYNKIATENIIESSRIDITEVIHSQQGVVDNKRQGLQYRLYKLSNKKQWYPNKRVLPLPAEKEKDRLKWNYKDRVRTTTRQLWGICKSVNLIDFRIKQISTSYNKKSKRSFLSKINTKLASKLESFVRKIKKRN